METRICKICKREKTINHYYKQPTGKGGYSGKCKICYLEYKRQWLLGKGEPAVDKPSNEYSKSPFLRLGVTEKEDYCMTYEFLEKIGYDPNGDIALQFANKWGLKYKKRDKKSINQYTYDDCNKKTPNE